MAKITIFGMAGTGTSTAGRLLSTALEYPFVSSGMLFRQMATDLGLSLHEFQKVCNEDPKYDIELDRRIEAYGKEHANCVVESRLAWHFIPDSIKIKLVCDFDERVRRVAMRDAVDFEKAKKETIFREDSILSNYAELYKIEKLAPDEIFDLIIDTTDNNPDTTLNMTLEFLKEKI
ncbi:MAG TPA: cytidylate kinase family protein [Candidatus Paceibacterota bacterium]|nr:cytidylate kinase family protein [Candidatus Paceibacterota bacterium]